MEKLYNILTKNVAVLIIGAILILCGSLKFNYKEYSFEIKELSYQWILIGVGILIISVYLWKELFKTSDDLSNLKQILKKYKCFEWQWAGQNWIGKVLLKKRKSKEYSLRVDIKKMYLVGKTRILA